MSYDQDDALSAEAQISASLLAALENRDAQALRALIADEHEADIADQLEQLTYDERAAIIALAPDIITPDILSEFEEEVLEEVLELLGNDQISASIRDMDSDDAAAIIEELDEDRIEDVLAALPAAQRESVEASFAFDDETAGRLMQRDFVAAPSFWTVGQTIDHMRAQGDNLPDQFFNIYIVDAALKPEGYVPLSVVVRKPRTTKLSELIEDLVTLIPQDMDQEDIAYRFGKYHLLSAPVVDAQGTLTGIITVDDIMTVVRDENTEDMLALAGVSDANLTDTAFATVKTRAPWLFINLATAILASLVISLFDFAISEFVALAVLMPIVASMGGNAGTQTLAVAVRDLADRDITEANAWRVVRREVLAGLFNGLIFAAVLALIALIWFGSLDLALVIFIAMVINHVFAGLAGILVPLGLKKFGADPAVASSVFVTTVTDVVGFFAFLGTAALLLF